jgi:hypothetical protein
LVTPKEDDLTDSDHFTREDGEPMIFCLIAIRDRQGRMINAAPLNLMALLLKKKKAKWVFHASGAGFKNCQMGVGSGLTQQKEVTAVIHKTASRTQHTTGFGCTSLIETSRQDTNCTINANTSIAWILIISNCSHSRNTAGITHSNNSLKNGRRNNPPLLTPTYMQTNAQNLIDFASAERFAKSEIVTRLVRMAREERLNYDEFLYVRGLFQGHHKGGGFTALRPFQPDIGWFKSPIPGARNPDCLRCILLGEISLFSV